MANKLINSDNITKLALLLEARNKAYIDNKLSTIDAITLNGYSIWVGTSEELPSEEDRDANTLYFEIGEEESDDVVENNIANGKLTLTTDKYQKVLNMVSGTEIVFPAVSKFTEIHLFFLADSNMDLVLPEGCKWRVDANIEAGNAYELVFKYNTLCWLADILVYS